MRGHRVIRFLCLVAFAAGLGWLAHKLKRTPEQKELTRYIEVEVPALLRLEEPADARLRRLGEVPGPKPEEARALLVDEVIPSLLKLKRQAGELRPDTRVVGALHAEYVAVIERLIAACRASVRVIDDPKVSTVDGFRQVRAEFDAVEKARAAWDRHVQEAARRHRLAPRTAP